MQFAVTADCQFQVLSCYAISRPLFTERGSFCKPQQNPLFTNMSLVLCNLDLAHARKGLSQGRHFPPEWSFRRGFLKNEEYQTCGKCLYQFSQNEAYKPYVCKLVFGHPNHLLESISSQNFSETLRNKSYLFPRDAWAENVVVTIFDKGVNRCEVLNRIHVCHYELSVLIILYMACLFEYVNHNAITNTCK